MVSGGDEARVARARGSGRGVLPSLILANGTPLSRVSPPRAGWAVRINEATLTTPSQSAHYQQQQHQQRATPTPGSPRAVEQWASERAALSALSVRRSTSPPSPETARRPATTGSSRRIVPSSSRVRLGGGGERGEEGGEGGGGGGGGSGSGGSGGRAGAERGAEFGNGIHFANHWQEEQELEAKKKKEHRKRCVDAAARCQAEHLELRGRPMSQNNAIAPLSRPPSSPTNASTNLDNTTVASSTTSHDNSRVVNADDGDAQHSVQQQQQHNVTGGGRVHDHNRPFPPPRLPTVHVPAASSLTLAANQSSPSRVLVTTAPLSPLSSTFRSRPRNIDTSTETTTNSRGLLSNDTPPRSPISEVSLTVPRPDGERAINEYVEAPFKHGANQERRVIDDDQKRGIGADCPKIDRRHRQKGSGGGGGVGGVVVADASVAATHRLHASRTQAFRGLIASGTNPTVSAGSIPANTVAPNAVTKQPVSFTKEPANSLASRTYDPAGLSIMCNFCGRCRCESCREPPPLPSKWLCNNKCFCSAETILDYASCLCCVKGLFYHCVDGNGGGGGGSGIGEAASNCADEPCSCTGSRRASRWACLGALTLVMPCLLCYWPFKGCVALCEVCYARHAAQGCRCNPNTIGNAGNRHHPIASDIGDSRDPEKRLLDPVTPEL
ncbi:hypothetical protein E2986_08498 [Frieseomelitta varia]|uniref:Protein sprouty n=1 Tax=Frieseomelitta varia TaxID=561572 RepID=A0A833R4A0_9HYME|nr:hypothetical protein E2986_08498 [Frieseomelitta varia]